MVKCICLDIYHYYELCYVDIMAHSHCTGTVPGHVQGQGWMIVDYAEMFALVGDRDRNQDPLSPVAPVSFPVPVPVQAQCSVNKALDPHYGNHPNVPYGLPAGVFSGECLLVSTLSNCNISSRTDFSKSIFRRSRLNMNSTDAAQSARD